MTAGAGAEQQADRVTGRLDRARAELAELELQVTAKRAQVDRLERQQHRWERGGAGERVVGAELDRMLADGWQVLHDVRWPGRQRANLDHVAVGPGGVVVVDAKNWDAEVSVRSGVLRAAGYRKDKEVDDALMQGAAVAAVLPAAFRSTTSSVICFVGQDLEVRSVRGVAVLSLGELREHLLTLPEVLGPIEVAAVAAQLRHALAVRSVPRQRAPEVAEQRPVPPPPRRRPPPARTRLLAALALVVAGLTMPWWLPAAADAAGHTLGVVVQEAPAR